MSVFRKYGSFYMAAGTAAIALRIYYGGADSDGLLWILAPVAWWVRILSGTAYEYLPGVGYVNHAFQFVIAPSCSGVRFLIIVMLMSVFSFTHRMETAGKRTAWFLGSAAGAYLYTIFVNGIRIVLSIQVPRLLQQADIGAEWLTQKQLHTVIGTAVYFISLLILYRTAEYLSLKMAENGEAGRNMDPEKKEGIRPAGRKQVFFLPPVLWYSSAVLGIPFLNRAWNHNWEGFTEYVCVVTGVCLPVLLLTWFLKKVVSEHSEKLQRIS